MNTAFEREYERFVNLPCDPSVGYADSSPGQGSQREECPHEIGDKVRFKPAAFARTRGEDAAFEIPVEVTGTVIQIHEEHRWYRVEYTMPGCIGREAFKF